nr:hypothetical protein [uncultured Lachnoclostridium sp.]
MVVKQHFQQGTTGSIAFLFLAIAIGFLAGNGVLVAQHYGVKDEEKGLQRSCFLVL